MTFSLILKRNQALIQPVCAERQGTGAYLGQAALRVEGPQGVRQAAGSWQVAAAVLAGQVGQQPQQAVHQLAGDVEQQPPLDVEQLAGEEVQPEDGEQVPVAVAGLGQGQLGRRPGGCEEQQGTTAHGSGLVS